MRKRLTNFLLLVVIALSSLTVNGQNLFTSFVTNSNKAEVSSTLIGHWNLNDGSGTVVSDVSGNLLDGTLSGGSWVADMNGNDAQAININDDGAGVYDKIVLSNDADVVLQANYTMAFWVKQNAVPNDWANVMSFGTTGSRTNNSGMGFLKDGRFYVAHQNKVSGGPDFRRDVYSKTKIIVGEWNHIAYTFDAVDSVLNIYINGVLEVSGTEFVGLTPGDVTFPSIMVVGTGTGGWTDKRDMNVDDIYFYGSALSEDKIATLAIDIPIAQWNLNEGSGTEVNDVTDNLPVGTLTGGAWVADMDGNATQALNFAATEDKAVLSTDNAVILQESYTVALWVKANTATDGNTWSKVLGFGSVAGKTNNSEIGMNNGTFFISIYGQDSEGVAGQGYFNSGKIVVGEWMHVAHTFDATSGMSSIYINGVLSHSRASVGLYTAYTDPTVFALGQAATGTGADRDIDIDNVAYYGTALSESEIVTLSGITFYELTTTASEGGTVSVGGSYGAGEVATVTATANEGYTFKGWSGDLSGSTNPESITMDADKHVTANFEMGITSPIAHWKIDEGTGTLVNDATNNLPAGTLSGGAWVDDMDGNTGQAININDDGAGVYDRIVLSNDADVVLQANYTMAFWVKQNAVPNDWANVMGFGTTAGKSDPKSNNVGMGFLKDGRFYVEHQCNASGGPDFRETAYSSAKIVVDEWNFITYTFDAVDSVLNVYFNGVLDVSKTSFVGLTPGELTFSSNMVVGTGVGGWTDARDMDIDDIYYYGKALSLAEINNIMVNPPVSDTLTVEAGLGGTITGAGVYDRYSEITVTAIPDEGYKFVTWGDDLSGNTNPEIIAMDGNMLVSATFKEDLPANLLLHYPMSQVSGMSAIDESGSGIDMPFFNIDDSNWKQSVIDGPSLHLDGMEEFGVLDSTITVDTIISSEYSVVTYFRLEPTSQDWVAIYDIANGVRMNVRPADRLIQLIYRSEAVGGFFDIKKGNNYPTEDIFDGKFHQLAMTHSTDISTTTTYLDGEVLGVRYATGDTNIVTYLGNNLVIGGNYNGDVAIGSFFPGDIQDFRFYEGILTPEEIKDLMKQAGSTSIAKYTFDETSGTTAVDEFNAFNLSLNNTDDSNWGDGVEKGSLSLNGTDQDGVSTSADFKLQTISLIAYVKCDPAKAELQCIASEGENYGFNVEADGNLGFYIHNDQGATSTATEGVNIKDGFWHHVAVTFDTSDMVVNMYLEGELVSTTTLAGGAIDWATASDFTVGSQAGVNFLQGSIDELYVYGIILDATTIKGMISERKTLTTNVSPDGTGTGSITPASGSMFYTNDVVTITATADDGSEFTGWDAFNGTIGGTANPKEITIKSDVVASAIFDEITSIKNSNTISGIRTYPNPFSIETTVYYELSNSAQVRLTVFDIMGKELTVLVNKNQQAGVYSEKWNGTDASGNSLNNGIYLLQIMVDSEVTIQKLNIIR